MNLLLDTSVLIDYIGRKAPFYAAAEQVVIAGFFGDARLWVPVQSLKDAFYVLRKYLPSDRIQSALAAACKVITPVDLSAQDALRALSLQWPDYEDCLIAISAEKAKANYLVTRDKRGFDRSLVPAISPSDLVNDVFASRGLHYGSMKLE